MTDNIDHEIELYLLEVFKTLFEHEVRESRRYKHPLSLIDIALQAEPNTPQTRHAAEMIAINTLDAELRDSDIPCMDGHEFHILLPSTDEQGARIACERLENLLNVTDQTQDGVSFQVLAFIGLASSHNDSRLTSSKLLEEASIAMNHARTSRSRKTAVHSEIR